MVLMDRMHNIMLRMDDFINNQSMSLLLGILGIAITIFTVVYSFMENTKEKKKLLFDQMNEKNNDQALNPHIRAEYSFAQAYLKNLWKINLAVALIILADILIIVIYLIHMVFKDNVWIWYLTLLAEASLIVFCLYTLYRYLKQYKQRFINNVN